MRFRMNSNKAQRHRLTALLSFLVAGSLACGGGGADPADGGGDAEGGGPAAAGGGGSAPDLEDVVHPIDGVEVETFAGSEDAGAVDGDEATFHNPVNVLVDADGNLVVADYDNNRMRVVSADGVADTLMQEQNFARPFGLTFTDDEMILVQTDWNEQGVSDGVANGVVWLFDPSNGSATPLATNVGKTRGLATLPNGLVVLSDPERHDLRLLRSHIASDLP